MATARSIWFWRKIISAGNWNRIARMPGAGCGCGEMGREGLKP